MSVMKKNVKVILPRVGPEEFWQLVQNHYATDDPLRWKALAMLALRENAGWPMESIAMVFGHHKGHVSRTLEKVKHDLRKKFERSPDWITKDDSEEDFDDVPQHFQAPAETGFSDPDRTSQ